MDQKLNQHIDSLTIANNVWGYDLAPKKEEDKKEEEEDVEEEPAKPDTRTPKGNLSSICSRFILHLFTIFWPVARPKIGIPRAGNGILVGKRVWKDLVACFGSLTFKP